LLATLEAWTRLLKLPLLSELGVAAGDFPRILANARGSSMKTNPIALQDAEIERILQLRVAGGLGA
jgi:alcohol dehydrogenase class IV